MPLFDRIIKEIKEKRTAEIDLCNMGLEDSDVSALAKLLLNNEKVVSLNLKRNNLSSAALIDLSNCHHLTTIDLTNNRLNDDNIDALLRLPNLETLILTDNNLSDKAGEVILRHLEQRTSLLIVSAAGNDKLSLDLLRKIDKQMCILSDRYGEKPKKKELATQLIPPYKNSLKNTIWHRITSVSEAPKENHETTKENKPSSSKK